MQINTTCPADKQIEGSDDFTDKEIRTLIDFDPYKLDPCPVEFHLAKVHITRLRVSLARGLPPNDVSVVLKVQQIFDSIWLFDLRSWLKDKCGDKDEEQQHQAHIISLIHALAIRLYGILTLPEPAVARWLKASSQVRSAYPAIQGCSSYEILRRRHREQLLGMLREHWNQVKLKKWLAWPLTVVGVAVVDDTVENKVFVDQSLLAVWKIPDVPNSSITGLQKLRTFWLSGKTGWEDCFDEPIPSSICL